MSCPKSSTPSGSTAPCFTMLSVQRPGAFARPPSRIMAPYLSPDPKHVIIYHLLTEGRGYAHVEGDGRPVPLNAGDIVVFPHGDPHILGNGSPVKPVDSAKELQRILSEDLKVSRHGRRRGTHENNLRLHDLRAATQRESSSADCHPS